MASAPDQRTSPPLSSRQRQLLASRRFGKSGDVAFKTCLHVILGLCRDQGMFAAKSCPRNHHKARKSKDLAGFFFA